MTLKAQLSPSLNDLLFSANITSLTLQSLTRKALPRTSGRVFWPASRRNTSLTILNPTTADISAIAGVYPIGSISRLGIAVDVRTKHRLAANGDGSPLTDMVEYVEKGLFPEPGTHQRSKFDGIYRRRTNGYELIPIKQIFSWPKQMVECGNGQDGVRVHFGHCTTTRGHRSKVSRECVRLEVRLGAEALRAFHLLTLDELVSFKFRRRLMPFLTHFNGSHRTWKFGAHWSTNELQLRAFESLERADAGQWQSVGIAAFLGRDSS